MTTNLAGCLLGLLEKTRRDGHKITQADLARALHIKQPSLFELLNEDTRPSEKTLAAIVRFRWPDDPTAGISCLLEHLRDEIDRAQLQTAHPGHVIRCYDYEARRPSLDEALIDLHDRALADNTVLQLILDINSLLTGKIWERVVDDAKNTQDNDQLLAAEDRPKYTTRRKKP